MKMPAGFAVLALTLFGAADARADDVTPLSREEKDRVEMLLSMFDPRSYSVSFDYKDEKGRVVRAEAGEAVGLSDVKQTEVERKFLEELRASTNTNNNIFRASTNTNNNIFRASTNTNNNIFRASTNTNNNIFRLASTNTNNNIFSVASTNTNNNIFSVASTNTNNNIFVDAKQAAAARDLNAVFTEHYMVDAAVQPMDLKDVSRVEELLSYFDPRSFSLSVEYVGDDGQVAQASFGKAVGLASVSQTSVERFAGDSFAASTNTNNNIFRVGEVASTNTNNNIFRVASTNTNNNIFRAVEADREGMFRVASTNTNNNIFVDAKQAAAAAELNDILDSYAAR